MQSTDYQLPKGRFAPSPSGRMHLGNMFTALMSWLSIKAQGGSWLLRIEDLDPQRSKPEFARLIEDDLLWLGLEWDEGGLEGKGPNGPYSQSLRSDFYAAALDRLRSEGSTFPCYCTRAEIMATQAPHQSDGRVVYPGTCRPKSPASPQAQLALASPQAQLALASSQAELAPRELVLCASFSSRSEARKPSTRLMVEDSDIRFTDLIAGPQSFNLARECGDFILQRADGAWAYQLAVVVDDAAMGVTEVMRGNDLLLSAAQQTWLYRRLGLTPPGFAHLPLICNAAGQRLSKRDASLSMEALRLTHTPESLTGYLAHLAGIIPTPEPAAPASLSPFFSHSPLRGRPAILLP